MLIYYMDILEKLIIKAKHTALSALEKKAACKLADWDRQSA
jgi:hypothetical protein